MAAGIKQLRVVRDSLKSQLTEIYDAAVAAKTDPSVRVMFEVRFEALNKIYERLSHVHSDLITQVVSLEDANVDDEHAFLSNADQMYFTIKATHRELFPPVSNQDSTPGVSRTSSNGAPAAPTRLPKLNLRNFDGKPENWTSFIQVFTHSIHNNSSLANIEKFEYLIGCLSNEPLNLIKSIPLSNDNYVIAYNSLTDRYDNKRDLATYFWKKIHAFPRIKEESSTDLRALCDNFNENLAALRALKISASLEDFLLFNILIDKLDTNTRRLFEAEIRDLKGDIPTLKLLTEFIDSQCRVLGVERSGQVHKINPRMTVRPKPVSAFVAGTSSVSTEKCYICDTNDHVIYSCPLLKSMGPDQRYKMVKDRRLCVNCLRPHNYQSCTSKSTCRTCRRKHHSMLHFETAPKDNILAQNVNISNMPNNHDPVSNELPTVNVSCVNTLVTSMSRSISLLSTAMVNVYDSFGISHSIRALLDSGSEASFMTAQCARKLNLRGNNNKIHIQGVGGNASLTSFGSVLCKINAREPAYASISVEVHIISHISSIIPSRPIPKHTWEHIQNLKLADPEYFNARPIDILLGADVYAQILRAGLILSPDSQSPSAINTMFGWVLTGTVQPPMSDDAIQSFHTTIADNCVEDDLPSIMKQFWEVEEVPVTSNRLPVDDICETLFLENYKRLPSGRFSVPLPFRELNPIFPDSKEIAIQRFYAIERRLKRDPILRAKYLDFMREYAESGHMERATPINSPCSFYIPHHCVYKAGSDKIRVVFDASTKSSNNRSLNDALLIGPKLQHNITNILLRFRVHPIVVVADVQHMYRQIVINPEFRNYQRIIWRFDPNEPLSEYILKTVTYGVASAPYLALRTIQQLALEGQDSYPAASQALLRDVYVDDIITGSDSVEQALTLQTQLISLLQSGGFPLRKWSSNHPALLQSLPAEHCQIPFSFDNDPKLTIKILGLQWTPSSDIFTYHFQELDRPCTKRGMLSELARIFDPLGFLSPITFSLKRMIQSLWSSGLGWDDPPPSEVRDQWAQYKHQLSYLCKLTIQRQILVCRSIVCQLHGFCDASLAGYAAAIFLRFEHEGSYVTRLIMAKSKVAPPNTTITIPRMELCGAVLLAKLLCSVQGVYADLLNINQTWAWTDSSIVLSWIRAPAYRWKPYVAHRVAYIQERLDSTSWHHISSADNPADCASRGLLPLQLLQHSIWWSGPLWLETQQIHWPTSNVDPIPPDLIASEERKVQVLMAQDSASFLDSLLSRFSSLRTLIHIVTYLLRFNHNCRKTHKSEHMTGPIGTQEYHDTLLIVVKLVQQSVFGLDLRQLRSKVYRKLNLFLDETGVIRVGGRLRHSSLAYEHKFPALLPKQHRLTDLIIEDTHVRHLHPGFRTLHYLLLQNFWILSPHRAIKACLSKCHKCFRTNPHPVQQPMADLPAFRLQEIKPFSTVGVDFGGPFPITMNRIRGSKSLKAYLCLFVCCSTRAVHLEIVSDLSSDAFLAALRRFISRRGRCTEIHSDCGTNFVGAARQLLEFSRQAAETEHILWKFNPPSASHFGGIWETGIRSVKLHIARVVGNQLLTFEELYTLVVQVEALLNSRPLCPSSSDPNDLSVLTPGHFLTLAPLTSFPEPDLSQIKLNRLSRWQLIQHMHQGFWKRWRQEFLHTLQQRAKWTNPSTPIPLGTIVLLKDDMLPPLNWHLGRVVEVHPGADGVIRVVTVKTRTGTLKRPVVKICPLPNCS